MPSDYKKAPLRMIFDMKKEDLRRKATFVVRGYRIDASHLETCSLVAQIMSLRISLTMAQKHGLKVMSGDVGNAFPHTLTMEKVHVIAGEEF